MARRKLRHAIEALGWGFYQLHVRYAHIADNFAVFVVDGIVYNKDVLAVRHRVCHLLGDKIDLGREEVFFSFRAYIVPVWESYDLPFYTPDGVNSTRNIYAVVCSCPLFADIRTPVRGKRVPHLPVEMGEANFLSRQINGKEEVVVYVATRDEILRRCFLLFFPYSYIGTKPI